VAVPAQPDAFGDPMMNKKYLRELQVYGGKANVASVQLMNWFHSLWHGKSLGVTLAVLTILAAWLFWFFATLPEIESDSPPKG
jgi:hypothetical protein